MTEAAVAGQPDGPGAGEGNVEDFDAKGIAGFCSFDSNWASDGVEGFHADGFDGFARKEAVEGGIIGFKGHGVSRVDFEGRRDDRVEGRMAVVFGKGMGHRMTFGLA